MPRKTEHNAHLLIEGPDDFHVISALCQHWQVSETFDILTPELAERPASGVDQLLENFRLYLKASNKRAIGMVLDANAKFSSRWRQVSDIGKQNGYDVPANPNSQGTILPAPQPHQPRIDVWIMPDNQASGELEDFVSYLIPTNDRLRPYARSVLAKIEAADLHRYRHKRSKALIHTWLAWQENPGQPMGRAITAKALSANSPLAATFVAWLNRLFN